MTIEPQFKIGDEVIIQKCLSLKEGTTGYILGYDILKYATYRGVDENSFLTEHFDYIMTYIVDVTHAYVQQGYCQKAIVLMDYQLKLKEY
jgi:hypothetical protein